MNDSPAISQPSSKFWAVTQLTWALGLALALYYAAGIMTDQECREIQIHAYSGGFITLIRALSLSFLMMSIGLPASLIAAICGTFLGPLMGAALSSLSVCISLALYWAVGRYAPTSSVSRFLVTLENMFPRLRSILQGEGLSGFHWTFLQSMTSPIPYPLLSLIVGSRVHHLSFTSFLSGAFAGSFPSLLAHSLAGASLGCAVINHANDFSVSAYGKTSLLAIVTLVTWAILKISLMNRSKGD